MIHDQNHVIYNFRETAEHVHDQTRRTDTNAEGRQGRCETSLLSLSLG